MAQQQPRIMLVDDEAAITANLAPFLERSGFVVIEAVGNRSPQRLTRTIMAIHLFGRLWCSELTSVINNEERITASAVAFFLMVRITSIVRYNLPANITDRKVENA